MDVDVAWVKIHGLESMELQVVFLHSPSYLENRNLPTHAAYVKMIGLYGIIQMLRLFYFFFLSPTLNSSEWDTNLSS